MKNQKVLVVDDVPSNIELMLSILQHDYAVLVANSGQRALEIIKGQIKPDIVILDIVMPVMDGYEVLKEMKLDQATKHIPVIFVTSVDELLNEEKGLAMGAVDYITKPFNPSLLQRRIKNHLELKQYQDYLEKVVHEKTKELNDTQLQIIHKLGRAAEYKDNETGFHVHRMSQYCYLLAIECGISESEAKIIYNAAPMHDIGKIAIPDAILLKPGKLTPEEYEVMKTHCAVGKEIIGEHDSDLLRVATILAYQHHEKWDGTGYPNGLKGNEIHIYGRIAAVADVFDALMSERPYKRAWSFEKAYELVNAERNKHFDPTVVDAFNNILPTIKEIINEYKV